MTKGQEEAIDYVQKQIDYYKKQIKFIEAVDSDYYDEEYELYKNRVKQFETVLNMLKEKDKEIEKKKKSLDNLENELNRLSERNLELFEESFEAQKKNEYWESRIKQGKKDVKGLKLYEIGIVCEDLKEEIEKKDKQIDLMAEQIKIPEPTMKIESFDIQPKTKFGMRYLNKEEVKQYFERKAKDGKD